jgi:hypothetical protein
MPTWIIASSPTERGMRLNLDVWLLARVAYQRSGLMKERTDGWVEFMPGVTATERKQNFFVIFSAMAGAVSIARLLIEPADREKVLAGMRDHILHSFEIFFVTIGL